MRTTGTLEIPGDPESQCARRLILRKNPAPKGDIVVVMRTITTTGPDGEPVVVTVPVANCPLGYPKGATTADGCNPKSDLGGARRTPGLKRIGPGLYGSRG